LVLVLQGIAFSCLFIPLTTVALTYIPRHNLADATGLNSLRPVRSSPRSDAARN